MYVVTRDDLYLVPTAEVPVTNLHRDEILEAAELPIRYAAYTPCFRREAGAAGKDTRGILRVHQFDKVEMVLFEKPDASPEALEWMTARAEVLLQRLGLPYRVLLMSTGRHGLRPAQEVRPGGLGAGRGALAGGQLLLQLRRLPGAPDGRSATAPSRARSRSWSTRSTAPGWRCPRVVAAILEVYQQPDGSVTVPEVLRPYMGTRPDRSSADRLRLGRRRRGVVRTGGGPP